MAGPTGCIDCDGCKVPQGAGEVQRLLAEDFAVGYAPVRRLAFEQLVGNIV